GGQGRAVRAERHRGHHESGARGGGGEGGRRKGPQRGRGAGVAGGQGGGVGAGRRRRHRTAGAGGVAGRGGAGGGGYVAEGGASATFHSVTGPPMSAAARVVPGGLTATETTGLPSPVGWLSWRGRAGSATSHSVTVPPSSPVARVVPLGLNATECTPLRLPVVSWRGRAGSATSHSVTAPPSSPAARVVPLGWTPPKTRDRPGGQGEGGQARDRGLPPAGGAAAGAVAGMQEVPLGLAQWRVARGIGGSPSRGLGGGVQQGAAVEVGRVTLAALPFRGGGAQPGA